MKTFPQFIPDPSMNLWWGQTKLGDTLRKREEVPIMSKCSPVSDAQDSESGLWNVIEYWD